MTKNFFFIPDTSSDFFDATHPGLTNITNIFHRACYQLMHPFSLFWSFLNFYFLQYQTFFRIFFYISFKWEVCSLLNFFYYLLLNLFYYFYYICNFCISLAKFTKNDKLAFFFFTSYIFQRAFIIHCYNESRLSDRKRKHKSCYKHSIWLIGCSLINTVSINND